MTGLYCRSRRITGRPCCKQRLGLPVVGCCGEVGSPGIFLPVRAVTAREFQKTFAIAGRSREITLGVEKQRAGGHRRKNRYVLFRLSIIGDHEADDN